MLSGRNKVKVDVLDESLDEHVAPSLGGVVVGLEHKIYSDPAEFFSRTLLTETMADVLENVANVLVEGKGSKIIVLSAFFGGGKTHTLIAIYHAVKNPSALMLARAETVDAKRRVGKVIEKLKGTDVVVIDGSLARLAPSPINPLDAGVYKVYTLWGYLAHALGRYDDFKSFDQTLTPPWVDNIVKLLSNKRLIVIVDEIAQYVQSLYSARDEQLRNYAKNVVIFFERLAKSVEALSHVVLVISLPVKAPARGEEFEVEKIYQADIVFSLLKSIQRVAASYVEPVRPRDIPALLKIRLFDEIDQARAKEVAEILRTEYERNGNVFGEVESGILTRIKEAYPFHPRYIDVLLDILDKHRGLQKTRDLIRISRKVIRVVVNDPENTYDLVMPWHIDVERDDIRSLLLTSDYEMFRLPVEEDIVKKCSSYEKAWVAKAAAKALFTRTFVYEGGLVPKVEFFPTPRELALLTYEPGYFRSKGALPKDVAEAIDWLTSNLLYVLRDERTQRLWFTYIKSPIKHIESIAQKITDVEAYKKVLEAVEDLLKEPVESTIERKRKKESLKVFDVELSKVSKECRPIDIDTRKYIVYACLDVDVAKKKEVLEEMIYKTGSGGTRRYVNTIYVVYPDQRERLLLAVNFAKKVIACEEVKRENIVDVLLRELKISAHELEIAREVYRNKIETYCRTETLNFYNSTIAAMTKLAYPVVKEGVRTFDETDLFIRATSIVYGVEETLSREGLKKVRRDLDFDTSRFLLSSIGIDLNSSARRVGDIVDYFYSNPRLPAVPEESIREAISEGVRKLEIGLRCGGKVYFKRVEKCEDEARCTEILGVEGEHVPSKAIIDDCEVLPYQDALKEQMESLKGKEWFEADAKYIEEYYIVLEGKLVNVKDVLSNFSSYDPDILREAPLVKLIKRVVVHIDPKSQVIKAKPEEEVKPKLVIRKVGPFKGTLQLRANYGVAEPSVITIDERFTEALATWVIKAPKEPGNYSYVLELVGEDGRVVASTEARVVVEAKVEIGWLEGVPPENSEVEVMEVIIEGRDLKPLGILRNRLGGFVSAQEVSFELRCARGRDKVSIVKLVMSDVGLDDVAAILSNIMQRFGLGDVTWKTSLKLVPAEGRSFRVPTLSNEELESLRAHKIRYRLIRK